MLLIIKEKQDLKYNCKNKSIIIYTFKNNSYICVLN